LGPAVGQIKKASVPNAVDRLAAELQSLVHAGEKRGEPRAAIFGAIWQRVFDELPDFNLPDRSTIPYLTEPWFC